LRVLIRNAECLITMDAGRRVLHDAALVVEGSRIAAVGTTAEVRAAYPGPFDREVDARGRLVMPGFVDTHLHVAEQLSRGLFPDNLRTQDWVFNWAKPFYGTVNDEEEYTGALLACAEMIKTGTTCFLDVGVYNDISGSARAVTESGIRAVLGRHAADRAPKKVPPNWTPEIIAKHYFKSAADALEALEDSHHRWHGKADGRIKIWINIEGKTPCSPELHAGATKLAAKLGVGASYHISSSIEEAQATEKEHGVWPVTLLERYGALGPNLLLAHVVAVRDGEVELLARHGVKVAFCPGTSFKLAKGATNIGRYPEMLKAGITMGLGCDGVAAAGSLDLMRQVYLVAGMFKDSRMDPDQVPAEQALAMGTIDGAKCLLWDNEIGSLEPGKKADLILVDINRLGWVPHFNVLQTLVYCATGDSVETVMIDGRIVMEGRKLQFVDERRLIEQAVRLSKEAARRTGLLPS
jgi:5-methylthioadenosine/S-adenosylhomocysteine deaminase